MVNDDVVNVGITGVSEGLGRLCTLGVDAEVGKGGYDECGGRNAAA